MIKIFKNFFSKEELELLNKEALEYLNKNILTENDYKGRLTTRYVEESFTFSNDVYNISNRVRKATGIDLFKPETGRGKNGINVAVTIEGGRIENHLDPRSNNNEVTYRCNVITQQSKIGGELIVDNKVVPLNVGDLHCYPVSEIYHIVSESKGDTPRILWMFGAHIPVEEYHKFSE